MRWRPYLIAAGIHAILGPVTFLYVGGLAIGLSNNGMNELPFWVHILAVFAAALLFPLPFALLSSRLITYHMTGAEGIMCLVACFANSMLVMALVRQSHIWMRNRTSRAAGNGRGNPRYVVIPVMVILSVLVVVLAVAVSLSNLPPEIPFVQALRERGNQVAFVPAKRDLIVSDAVDLSPLLQFDTAKIERATIDSETLTDISPLASLKSLQRLKLKVTRVADWSPLSRLSQLRHLDLAWSKISDIAPLSKLGSLEYLDLTNTGVSDLSPLSGLSQLRHLDLSVCKVSNLSFLRNLSNLEELHLDSLEIPAATSLANLRKLEHLSLQFSKFEPALVSGLKSLKYLDLTNAKLSDAEIAEIEQKLPNCIVERK